MIKNQILIVEDDAITAMYLERRLNKLGYSVSAIVGCGEEAVEKVKENPPDLVLMDIVLKGEIDGIETAQKMRTHFDVAIIFLTAHANKDRLERTKLVYPFGFIFKPVEDEDLGVAIEMALYTAKVDKESKRLEEDLRIHQAELVTQNEQLRQAQLDLEAARDKYSDLYDFAPAGHFTISEQGLILEANLTSATLLRTERKLLIGKTFTKFITKDDQDVYYLLCKRLFKTKTRQACELKLISKDGTGFDAQLECIAKQDAEGNFSQFRAALIDISERKKLEEQVRHAFKMEAIGTLTGGVAHEFNNILGIIIGNTELALEDVPGSSPAHSCLEEIQIAGLRARDVVRHLLSFSRKINLERKQIKIIPAVRDALKFIRVTIPASIEIRQDIQAKKDTVLADATQIHQIMINLGTNAFHAMHEDGGILGVEIQNVVLDKDIASVDPDLTPGNYVKITVSDTGQGIDPLVIDRIFDPYFTTKEVGQGSGMGLAVVHGIVKNHDGALTVASKPGQGTAFSVYFPVVKAVAAAEPKSIEKLPSGHESILFVDDEEAIVKMTRQRLELLGYTVEAVTSPVEALELLRSNPSRFDLVITDMTMPRMTGDKLVQKILSIRPDMPIILCTGFSAKINGEKAEKIGVAGYLEKPHDQRELALAVRNVLDKRMN